MIEINDLSEFLYKRVDIGTPNYNFTDITFYYTGFLREISNTDVKLKTKKGYRLIPICEIIEIRLSKEEVN